MVTNGSGAWWEDSGVDFIEDAYECMVPKVETEGPTVPRALFMKLMVRMCVRSRRLGFYGVPPQGPRPVVKTRARKKKPTATTS
jgi:hypothetical protein